MTREQDRKEQEKFNRSFYAEEYRHARKSTGDTRNVVETAIYRSKIDKTTPWRKRAAR